MIDTTCQNSDTGHYPVQLDLEDFIRALDGKPARKSNGKIKHAGYLSTLRHVERSEVIH